MKILCAIVNSKLAIFYIKTKYASSSYCGGITFTKEMLNNFPISNNLLSQQKPIISLVDKILSAKAENPQINTTIMEQKIDKIVYDLYDLTEAEVAIVERS